MTYPGGESLYYSYNTVGGVESICNTSDCSDERYYHIDPNSAFNVYGNLLQETYGNGVTSNFDYYTNSHRLQQATITSGSNTFSQRQYEYDAYSNITKLYDALDLTSNGGIALAEYDVFNRLTGVQGQNDTFVTSNLTYDDSGNLSTYGAMAYEYNDSAHPHAVTDINGSTFVYDSNGNMTSDPDRQMEYLSLIHI